jgi:transposase InsO family protein
MPMLVLMTQNDRWSLDFDSDQLTDGRRFRILTVVDDCTRECLALVADHLALQHPRGARAGPAGLLLNEMLFTSLAKARVTLGRWRADYHDT